MKKVEEVLSMKGGFGDESYALNSSFQRSILEKTKPTLEEALRGLCGTMSPSNKTSFLMADLGCSSGPNTLAMLSNVLNVLDKTCHERGHQILEIKAFLNDLPGTDFNTLFRLLSVFCRKLDEEKKEDPLKGSCFVSGTPGSFYGRLFPDKFLHFVHSSTSLHFLSQMPEGLVSGNGEAMNKGNICIAETSPPQVHQAYYNQFKNDFTAFLRFRSEEIVDGGYMVLTFRVSYNSHTPEFLWDIQFLGLALNAMALQGLVDKEKLDAFNMPLYTPTVDEVKELIEKEGSFALVNAETFQADWRASAIVGDEDVTATAKFVEDGYRAMTRPILAAEFGEGVMDQMYRRLNGLLVDRLLTVGNLDILSVVVSLAKRSS